jgi:hypothetical protein
MVEGIDGGVTGKHNFTGVHFMRTKAIWRQLREPSILNFRVVEDQDAGRSMTEPNFPSNSFSRRYDVVGYGAKASDRSEFWRKS